MWDSHLLTGSLIGLGLLASFILGVFWASGSIERKSLPRRVAIAKNLQRHRQNRTAKAEHPSPRDAVTPPPLTSSNQKLGVFHETVGVQDLGTTHTTCVTSARTVQGRRPVRNRTSGTTVTSTAGRQPNLRRTRSQRARETTATSPRSVGNYDQGVVVESLGKACIVNTRKFNTWLNKEAPGYATSLIRPGGQTVLYRLEGSLVISRYPLRRDPSREKVVFQGVQGVPFRDKWLNLP